MFNKYFNFISELFESVFKGGEAVSFVDYLYVIGFTLGLIVCAALILAVVFFICKGPVMVYKKITKSVRKRISEIDKAIIDKNYEKYPENTIADEYNKLEKQLIKRRVLFGAGVVCLYIPIVIPTILFIISLVKSWL